MKTCKSDDCNMLIADEHDYCFACRSKPKAPLKGDIEYDIEDIPIRKIRPVMSRPENGYLLFQCASGHEGDRVVVARPCRLFKPVCLMLWGFDDTTVIKNLYIGNHTQGAVNFGELPASFFGTAKSYEKLIEDFTKNGIAPPSWINWNTVDVGQDVSIHVQGPLTHAVMLGKVAY